MAVFADRLTSVDSAAEGAQVFDDFQLGLDGIERGLSERGITLEVRLHAPLELTIGRERYRFAADPDSGGVAYLFATPGRPLLIRWGVPAEAAVLATADSFLLPPRPAQ